jgi:hypothetical protein
MTFKVNNEDKLEENFKSLFSNSGKLSSFMVGADSNFYLNYR